jgi:hypothetical protein
MAYYLSNAFSVSMLADVSQFWTIKVEFVEFSPENAYNWARSSRPESFVGHQDTANLLTRMLNGSGYTVKCNRGSLALKEGDELLVAQYIGARLSEGATELPEGAQIKWVMVSVVSER